jgi:hypothetical protein
MRAHSAQWHKRAPTGPGGVLWATMRRARNELDAKICSKTGQYKLIES